MADMTSLMTSAALNLFNGVATQAALGNGGKEADVAYGTLPTLMVNGMLMESSSGPTRDQLLAVSGCSDPSQYADWARELGAVASGLREAFGGVDGAKMTLASRLFVADSSRMTVDPKVTDALLSSYGSDLLKTKFAEDPEAARALINDWVHAATNTMIPELMPEGSVVADTVFVAAALIYLLAPWESAFNPDMTKDAPFRTLGGETKVRMMRKAKDEEISLLARQGKREQAETRYGQADEYLYAKDGDLQAISMRYKVPGLDMTVIQPKDPSRLPALRQELAEGRWGVLREQMRVHEMAELGLPRFGIAATGAPTDMKKVLRAMGVTVPFTKGEADFSRLTGSKNVYISDFVAKAAIKTTEEGSEMAAAAAAAGVMESLVMGPPTAGMVVDSPYLAIVSYHGLPLFPTQIMMPVNPPEKTSATKPADSPKASIPEIRSAPTAEAQVSVRGQVITVTQTERDFLAFANSDAFAPAPDGSTETTGQRVAALPEEIQKRFLADLYEYAVKDDSPPFEKNELGRVMANIFSLLFLFRRKYEGGGKLSYWDGCQNMADQLLDKPESVWKSTGAYWGHLATRLEAADIAAADKNASAGDFEVLEVLMPK